MLVPQPSADTPPVPQDIAVAAGCRLYSLDPVVGFLEIGHLMLCFFASNSVALLNSAYKLITLPFDHLLVVVGQLPPLFLGFADDLLPISLELVGVHLEPPFTW